MRDFNFCLILALVLWRCFRQDPESFMIQWLRRRAPHRESHAMPLRRRNAALKEEPI